MSEAGVGLGRLDPQEPLPNLQLCCLVLELDVGMGSGQKPRVGVLLTFHLFATSARFQGAERRI